MRVEHPIGEPEIDLDLEARLTDVGARPGLLERVAFTLGSTLDLREVLHTLAEMVQEVAAAQRCSIVLIEGDRLKPAVAIGARPNENLWSAFRAMPPIDLRADEWAVLRRGRALAWHDARLSPYIPKSWIERFSLRAIALVPLLAKGEPCGVMAVDWPDVRPVDAAELAVLEAIGTYAGVAVHNARLHDRVTRKSRSLEHAVEVAAALNSSTSLTAVLDLVCDGFQELLKAIHVSVNLADPANPLRVRTLATRGEEWFARIPDAQHLMPPEALVETDDDVWRATVGPIVYRRMDATTPGVLMSRPPSVHSAALFPLFGPNGLIGSVVAGFSNPAGPDPEELDVGQTLAELAAAAIGRADLDEQLRRRVQQLEVLSRLSAVVAGTTNLETALAQVNDALGPELGTRLLSVSVVHPDLRSAIGGRAPDAVEDEVIQGWCSELRSGADGVGLRRDGDHLLVPVVHHRRVQGVLRVSRLQDGVDLPEEEFLLALGRACAEVTYRASVSYSLAIRDRRLAVSAERERIAHDLHDSTGQVITGMGLKLTEYVRLAPDAIWRSRLEELLTLARRGEAEMREAIYALLFAQVREAGLTESLRDLVERFENSTGVNVRLAVVGEPVGLGLEREDALFRAAHEALSNVDRHANAGRVDLLLAYTDGEVLLEVRDDGVGLPTERVGQRDRHFGLAAVADRVERVGGAFHVANGDLRGTAVTAAVPTA